MNKLYTSIISFASLVSSAVASPVNINLADAPSIADALNGIGQSKAEAIVAYRETNGQFASVDDLVMVKGIGDRTLERIREDILLTDTVVE